MSADRRTLYISSSLEGAISGVSTSSERDLGIKRLCQFNGSMVLVDFPCWIREHQVHFSTQARETHIPTRLPPRWNSGMQALAPKHGEEIFATSNDQSVISIFNSRQPPESDSDSVADSVRQNSRASVARPRNPSKSNALSTRPGENDSRVEKIKQTVSKVLAQYRSSLKSYLQCDFVDLGASLIAPKQLHGIGRAVECSWTESNSSEDDEKEKESVTLTLRARSFSDRDFAIP
ncbi:hypothetical protein R3P38DRAFT_2778711 [Favolaschia claudopus]|uniref:Uncharacterized protein n=1 Tax=Favolaschia claudopus TaxID=2862362 RepID=A0AAW0BF15_9AGAR